MCSRTLTPTNGKDPGDNDNDNGHQGQQCVPEHIVDLDDHCHHGEIPDSRTHPHHTAKKTT